MEHKGSSITKVTMKPKMLLLGAYNIIDVQQTEEG